jgi:transposase
MSDQPVIGIDVAKHKSQACLLAPDRKEFRLQSLLKLQNTLSYEVNALHKRIKQEAEKHPEVCRVMTVPGFGPITAATFIGEIGSYKLYPSAAQIIAAAGVDPTVYQSGAYQGGTVG